MTVAETRTQRIVPVRGPTTSGSKWRRRALVGVLFAALLLLMRRPDWHTLTHTYASLGDDVFLSWSISWTGHALASDPLHLFDANIYWPHAQSLAYADNLMVLLAPFAFIRWMGGSWPLALNVATLAMLFLSLAATYSLTRWLTDRTDASILAAIAYTFGAFTFAHQAHTQLVLLGFFPLAFLLLFQLLERPTLGAAIRLGAVNIAIALGSLYYIAIYAVCLVVIVAGYVIVRRRSIGSDLLRTLLVAGGVSLIAIPFLWPYYELHLTRPLETQYRLQPEDLLTPARGSYLYPGLDHRVGALPGREEHSFFPGFTTLVLAAVGAVALVVGLRRRPTGTSDATPTVSGARADRQVFLALLAVCGALSVLIAIGPEARGVPMPFRFLHDDVPGFGGIRGASRLAVPGLLALAVFAATGFVVITRRLRPARAAMVAAALCGFLLLELAAPLVHTTLPSDRATLAVYHALSHAPAGAVVELPIVDTTTDPVDWYLEAPRMLYSSIDWHPRFNGYSGGFPDDYAKHTATLNRFPSAAALREMKKLRIRYAVLHTGRDAGAQQYTKTQVAAMLAALPPGAHARRHGNAWLVDLGPSFG